MVPIRDHNPSEKIPFVTYAIIALNAVVLFGYSPLLSDDVSLSAFFSNWGMIPGLVTSGDAQYTLVTSMFLHADIMHLVGNMLFLWIFGDNLEEELGHIGFLVFYLVCGIGAGLAHLISDPYSMIPGVGASGAIAGVMGGYLLFFPKARVDVVFVFIAIRKVAPVPAWVMLGVWFAKQLFLGFSVSTAGGGVAYWAHSGGFLIGLAYVLPIWLKRGGAEYWRINQGQPPHPAAKY